MEDNKKESRLIDSTIKSLVFLENQGFEAYKDMILNAYAISDRMTKVHYGNNKERFDEDKLSGVISILSIVTNAKFNKVIKVEDKEKYNALLQLLLDRTADLMKIRTEEDVEIYCKK